MRNLQSIVFAWDGFQDYAARCIRAVIDRHPGIVRVIAMRPEVPAQGMEKSLGQDIVWLDGKKEVDFDGLGIRTPDLFFQGGYHKKTFSTLGSQCRRRGGKVVCLADTAWQGNLRQVLIDPLRHRALLRSRFDGLFVPGSSGLQHATYMGYSAKTTLSGLLGADPDLFSSGDTLAKRSKTFLFVGRLEPIKNVLNLVAAFERFSSICPDWRLRICGSGSQEDLILRHPRIQVDSYLQPQQVAIAMREARCLVLPTLREAWGLVVHEAALSGCALALSSAVGSAADFAEFENSVLFAPGSTDAIEKALYEIASWEDDRWRSAEDTSIRLASKFGPRIFADSVDKFIQVFS